jgi:hypothetical protein
MNKTSVKTPRIAEKNKNDFHVVFLSELVINTISFVVGTAGSMEAE